MASPAILKATWYKMPGQVIKFILVRFKRRQNGMARPYLPVPNTMYIPVQDDSDSSPLVLQSFWGGANYLELV